MKSQDYVFKLDNIRANKLSRSEIIIKLKEFFKINNHRYFSRSECVNSQGK
jgi:hypothetical protein